MFPSIDEGFNPPRANSIVLVPPFMIVKSNESFSWTSFNSATILAALGKVQLIFAVGFAYRIPWVICVAVNVVLLLGITACAG